MSRQSVQQHLNRLRDQDVISFISESGATTRFQWNEEHSLGSALGREGQAEVDAGRRERRAARKAARQTTRPPKAQVQVNGLAPVSGDKRRPVDSPSIQPEPPRGASSNLAPLASSEFAAGARSDLAPGARSSACTKKPLSERSKESS